MYTLHDAGIGTWGLYTKWTNCMLQLVHDDYWPNAGFACYRLVMMMVGQMHDLHVTG